jgi:hypothetical protein
VVSAVNRLYDFECELTYRERPALPTQRKIEKLLGAGCGSFDREGAVIGSESYQLAAGEEAKAAHDRISARIRRLVPEAKVTTRWAFVERPKDWDEEYTTG